MKSLLFWSKVWVTMFFILGALIAFFTYLMQHSVEQLISIITLFLILGILLAFSFMYIEVFYMPKRKKSLLKFLSESFTQQEDATFEFTVNGYTGTLEYTQQLGPSKAPYREGLSLFIRMPLDWPQERIKKMTFLCENIKNDDTIYFKSYYEGRFKLDKIMKFIEFQTNELNRRF